VGKPYGPLDLKTNCASPGFVVDGGVFPFGLNLSGSGTITGTPTGAGDWSFTVKVYPSPGSPITQLYSLSTTQGCAIRPAVLPGGAVGNEYPPTTLQASNGCGNSLSWSLDGGTFPPGLVLDPVKGDITGTPTTPGTYSFAISVDGGLGATTQAYLTNVGAQCALSPPGVAGSATYDLFQALQGVSYTQNITPTLGCGGAFFDIKLVAGNFSPGLQWNLGSVQGTPTGTGTSDFVVSICGSTGVASQAYEVQAVNPPGCVLSPGVDPSTSYALPDAHQNQLYSAPLSVSKGCGTFGSGAFTVSSGTLPPGLSLNGIGTIVGTPTATGTSQFTVSLAGSSGSGSQPYTLNVVSP
jgi:hypothetical protein